MRLSQSDGASIGTLEAELDEARRELREFAQGVHPAALTERGLVPALTVLAARSTIPVVVEGTIERLPEPIEAALFFVCSEALANVAKHAAASRASIELLEEEWRASWPRSWTTASEVRTSVMAPGCVDLPTASRLWAAGS